MKQIQSTILLFYILIGVIFLFNKQNLVANSYYGLKGKESNHDNEQYKETILLNTDRNYYVSGEPVLCNMFVSGNISTDRLPKSTVAYLELKDMNFEHITGTKFLIDSGQANGQLLVPDSLSSSFYYLKAYTNVMKNHPSQIFTKLIYVVNRFGKQGKEIPESALPDPGENIFSLLQEGVDVETDSKQYGPRDEVSVKLKLNPESSFQSMANVSVAVYEIPPDSLWSTQQPDSLFIDSMEVSKKNDSVLVSQSLQKDSDSTANSDTLISKQTSNAYWSSVYKLMIYSRLSDSILKEKRKCIKTESADYLTEEKGYLLRGKVIDQTTGAPVPNTTVFLTVFDTIPDLRYDKTDHNGNFVFLFNNNYGKSELLFQMMEASVPLKRCEIQIMDNYLEAYCNIQKVDRQNKPAWFDKFVDSYNVKHIYKNEPLYNPVSTPVDSLYYPFYGYPDYTVYPDDYIALPSLEEITKELLHGVRIRKTGENYHVRLYNLLTDKYFEESPLILLNGVPIHDINQIHSYNSKDIERIEVIQEPRIYGQLLFHGVIAIFTNDFSKLYQYEFADRALKTHCSFYAIPVKYNPPEYNRINDKKRHESPDFRPSLYWKKNIELSKNDSRSVDFYTSDAEGYYLVKVNGVTKSGKEIKGYTTFWVKK